MTDGPSPRKFDEAGDATRRTHLANERTYLAWWRSGLAALAVSVAVGKVVPDVAHQTRWPFAVLGAGFAVLGLLFIVYGHHRQRAVRDAVMRGDYAHPGDRFLAVLTFYGALLSLVLLALVIVKT